MDESISIVVLVMMVFFLAGMVKGIVGFGLPSISLALLTLFIDITSAMVLLVVPSLVTNFWQALVGGNLGLILRKTWLFLTMATSTIWVGVLLIPVIQINWLSALLGLLLIAYALSSLSGFRLASKAYVKPWAGALFGGINGMVTGLTGSFVMPGVMYLQVIGLRRDQLVQAMGVLFFVSTIVLGIALTKNNFVVPELGRLSVLSVVPVCCGMFIGKKIRHTMSETVFRRFFCILLLTLGAYVLMESLFTL